MPKLADVALESAALMEPTLSAALVPLAERLARRETGLQLVNEKGWSVSAEGVRLMTVLSPCCSEEPLHRRSWLILRLRARQQRPHSCWRPFLLLLLCPAQQETGDCAR